MRPPAIAVLAILAFALPAASQSRTPVDRAYDLFKTGDYAGAYDILAAYRTEKNASLRIDYMLGASACTFADRGAANWGRRVLTGLSSDYKVSSAEAAAIERRLDNCPLPRNQQIVYGRVGTRGEFREAFAFRSPTISDVRRPVDLAKSVLEKLLGEGAATPSRGN